MRTKYANITKEQQEYRNAILKRRQRKPRYVTTPEPPMTREKYMNNCIFWIQEYLRGRTDIQRAVKAVFYLKQYCDEILKDQNDDKQGHL